MLKEGLESFRTASSAASQMGGVKMSLKEKTAADRHRELMGDPNFKKRLSANKETRAPCRTRPSSTPPGATWHNGRKGARST